MTTYGQVLDAFLVPEGRRLVAWDLASRRTFTCVVRPVESHDVGSLVKVELDVDEPRSAVIAITETDVPIAYRGEIQPTA